MPGLRERRRFSAVFVIALVVVVLTGFCFFKSSRAEVLLPNESGPELFHDTIRVGSFSVYLVNNVYLGERMNFWGGVGRSAEVCVDSNCNPGKSRTKIYCDSGLLGS